MEKEKSPKKKDWPKTPEDSSVKPAYEEFWENELEEIIPEEEGEQSESLSTTFSQLTIQGSTAQPASLGAIIPFVKELLENLVAKRPENVIEYFGEFSRRVQEKIKETFGIGDVYFQPFAELYTRWMRSFVLGFEKVKDENDTDVVNPVQPVLEESNEEEEEIPKNDAYYAMHIMEYTLEDDDFDESGRHGKVVFYDPKIDYEYSEFEYNFLDQMRIFDDVGLGLTNHEKYEIHFALHKLVKQRNLQNLKFWGKIKGLYKDYYILECDMYAIEEEIKDELEEIIEPPPMLKKKDSMELFSEEEEETDVPYILDKVFPDSEIEGELDINEPEIEALPEELDEEFANFPVEEPAQQILSEERVEEEETPPKTPSVFELEIADEDFKNMPLNKITLKNYKLPPLPVPKWKPEKQPPMEDPGEGVNKKIYFVANNPKCEWIRLPHVTPEQIVVARQVKKFFTGYLSARILSYPTFPGIEMNLLRAQIARISAGTQISPAGYFRFDEGEEAYNPDDVAAGKGNVLINKEFDPMAIKDLTDPTLAFWVHHTPYILKQGRTIWYNVNKKKAPMREEMFGEFGEMGEDETPGETGPPLLTSLAEDVPYEGIPPWTVRPALELAPADACVYVRSNLWPGAHSFSWGRKIGFLYIGWGMKYWPSGFTPALPPPPQLEYPQGPDIKEDRDPTVAEEDDYKKQLEEWWKKMHPPMLPVAGEGEVESEDDV
ncbi:radial spoke head protein 6 homolog A-like [Cimex lectularius]|uniref:Uncharacterized protein n=1 Tax=Cimex lectularius TaxID=79782 RepID=A0A8I6TGI6_CIMLE|nr:radial spoke head protein 6 homolog A-like [Cimex lectularius]